MSDARTRLLAFATVALFIQLVVINSVDLYVLHERILLYLFEHFSLGDKVVVTCVGLLELWLPGVGEA